MLTVTVNLDSIGAAATTDAAAGGLADAAGSATPDAATAGAAVAVAASCSAAATAPAAANGESKTSF